MVPDGEQLRFRMLKSTRRYREVIVKTGSVVLCDHPTAYGAPPKVLDNPQAVADMWPCISGTPEFRDAQENFVVIYLDTRRKYIGHAIVTTGAVDSVTVHAREVFRGAIMANAQAVLIMHNHPSGNPSPSEADIRVTRDLIRAGQLLKIEVLDHVVMGRPSEGNKGFCSLRELGYFHGV